MIPYLEQAWRLVHGLITSRQTIGSTALLLFVLLYMFACLGVEIITKDAELRNTPGIDIDFHFGSLPKFVLTLLQFVTLDAIASLYMPLIDEKPLLLLYFLPIMLFMSIALMNLVTAVLVEAALDEAESDKQQSTLEMKRHLQEQLPVFNSLFNRLDTDNS